jgi:hypothetical protein
MRLGNGGLALAAATVCALAAACDFVDDEGGADGGLGGGVGSGGGAGGGVATVPDKPHSTGGSSWTVLVYMVADNDLEPFALQDLVEMMQVGSKTGLNLVVQVDRAEGYAADAVGGLPNFTGAKRLLVRAGSLQELSDLGEVNMADPATLSSFLSWGLGAYPADRTALVFWDHGGGWTGFGLDEASGNQLLRLPQIEAGISQGLRTANSKPLALVGFDACLMATWEVSLTLAPHAEYLLASEETEPGHGWDWRALAVLAQNPATDTPTLGLRVLQAYQAQAVEEKTADNITLSLIDLYRLGTLGRAIDAVTKAFDGTPPSATAFGRGQERAQKFGDSPEPARALNLVDLGSLVQETAKEAAPVSSVQQQLATALSSAVVHHVEGAAKRGAKGMAVYFPPDSRYYDQGYEAIPAAAEWRAFLKSYFGTSNGSTAKPVFTNPNHLADTGFDTDGALAVQGTLAADGASSVARAVLYEGIVDGNSLIVVGEEPALYGGTSVAGTWDLSVLSLSQGSNVGYGYSSFSTVDASHAELDVVFAYRKSPSAEAQYCLRSLVFSVDGSGGVTLSSDAYFLATNGVFGELSPVAGSTLMPLVKTIDLDTGEEALAEGASAAFTASAGAGGRQEFQLDLSYQQFVSGTQVFGMLSVQNAAGEGDAVIGVEVAP